MRRSFPCFFSRGPRRTATPVEKTYVMLLVAGMTRALRFLAADEECPSTRSGDIALNAALRHAQGCRSPLFPERPLWRRRVSLSYRLPAPPGGTPPGSPPPGCDQPL